MGAYSASGLRAVKPGGRIGGHGAILHLPKDGCQQGKGVNDEVVTKYRWWHEWPSLLLIMFAVGGLGLIPAILLLMLVYWLKRWPRVHLVALWVLIPCLAVTFIVAKSTMKDRMHEFAVAALAPSSEKAAPSQNIYEQMDPQPTSGAVATQAESPPDGPWRQYQTEAEAATGVGSESRCYSNDPQTGQCLNWVTPPAGFHWDKSPADVAAAAAAVPVADAAGEAQRWDDDATAFIRDHSALTFGQNMQIMQEKLRTTATPSMTNMQMLTTAYNATLSDRRWSSVP